MKIYRYHHMKEYSNMKIGGIAKELIVIDKKDELVEVLKTREKTFLIGNGTNTLIPDRDMDISFISLNKLNKVEDLGNGRVYVESGLNFDNLIDFTEEKNYSGLENLAGIPSLDSMWNTGERTCTTPRQIGNLNSVPGRLSRTRMPMPHQRARFQR